MIFFLDKNFPKPSARILTDRGHAIVDIRGTVQAGATDDSIFRLAQERGAVLLTTDKDFYHAAIRAKLKIALDCIARHGIANRSLLLTDRRIYIR
jgi:predicted nuclease of predicted toxin-antitoxin system